MSPVSQGVVALTGDEPRRADARRNRARLVEQARIAFTEFGVDASLDEIARRAGVASGTLYRHFPTRSDLIAAVLAEQVAALVGLGRELLTTDDELDALVTWLRAALRHGLTYRGLAAAAMRSERGNGPASTAHAELFEVGAALLSRARRSGAVATNVDENDVLTMVGAIAWAAQDAPDGAARAERLLTLLLNGLRHGAGRS